MLDPENIAATYRTRLNHMGLAGLSGHLQAGHLQAALSTTAGWHFKTRLLRRSWHALGTDLLHVLPVEDNAERKLDGLVTKILKSANFPHDQPYLQKVRY